MLIEQKIGNKTVYLTEDEYKKLQKEQNHEGIEKDMTTSRFRNLYLGISEEKYNKIFKKGDKNG